MDAKLWFWTGALVNMGLIAVLAWRGVLEIRAGRVQAHHRSMTAAGALVVLFLAAYLVKRAVLGGEDLAAWSTAARTNLFVHESFVLVMLVAGGVAGWRGRGLARTRRVTGAEADPPAAAAALRAHRRAGWVAVVCVGLGLATACGILAGMLGRS
jgi:hypothetical protein